MPNPFRKMKASSILLFLFFCGLVSHTAWSQEINLIDDLMFVDSVVQQQIPDSGHRPYIYKNQPKSFKTLNPVGLLYGGSLYVYQNFFSQHLSASCLYNPSCSDFSKQAVKEYGLIKGTLLSFDRLSRCNRIAATDLNPEDADPHIHRFNDAVKKYK